MGSFNLEKAIAARSLASPQRNYLWRIQLPDLTQPYVHTLTGGQNFDRAGFFYDNNMLVPDALDISLRVKSITTPGTDIETDKQQVGSSYWYYGKKNDISTLSIDVVEYEDGATLAYFNAWQALQKIPATATRGPFAGTVIQGTMNPPAYYKFDIKVFRLSSLKTDLYEDTYKGYFVNNIAEVSSDYDTSSMMSISITFTGDDADMHVYNIPNLKDTEAQVLAQKLNIHRKFSSLTSDDIKNLIPQVFDDLSGRF